MTLKVDPSPFWYSPLSICSNFFLSTLNLSWYKSDTSLSPILMTKSWSSSLESQFEFHPEVHVPVSETSDCVSEFLTSTEDLEGAKLHAIVNLLIYFPKLLFRTRKICSFVRRYSRIFFLCKWINWNYLLLTPSGVERDWWYWRVREMCFFLLTTWNTWDFFRLFRYCHRDVATRFLHF